MLDDLRKSAAGDDFDEVDNAAVDVQERSDRTFLGMTAVERMFLSIFFFMNVLILGIAVLLVTGRLVL